MFEAPMTATLGMDLFCPTAAHAADAVVAHDTDAAPVVAQAALRIEVARGVRLDGLVIAAGRCHGRLARGRLGLGAAAHAAATVVGEEADARAVGTKAAACGIERSLAHDGL